MALKPCRECGAQDSTAARQCPQRGVGAPTRNASRLKAEAIYDSTVAVIRWLVVGAAMAIGLLLWMNVPKTAEQMAISKETVTASAQSRISSARQTVLSSSPQNPMALEQTQGSIRECSIRGRYRQNDEAVALLCEPRGAIWKVLVFRWRKVSKKASGGKVHA